MATYPNNPQPWSLQSGRWADANGDLIPFTQADERAMFLAKIKDLEDFLEYEKARVQTAEHVTSKANKELNEEMTIRRRLDERVQTLREALEDARIELEAQAIYFGPHLDPENNLFRILRKVETTLKATKEGA